MDENLFAELAKIEPGMKEWFAWLHENAELSGHEVNTSAYVANLLESWGYDVTRNVGENGVVATLKRGSGAHSIGLRADMDALPVQEDGTCRVTSKTPGVSHMCGHDGHMAMLLGAARYLAESGNFNGTLTLVFQPAEENFSGAQKMIDDGLFERFPVESMFGLHNSPSYPTGKIYLGEGPILTASDYVRIVVHGKGAHGAFPHAGCDPIVAASSIVMALQSVISRNLDPRDTGVITVGKFQAGTAENIIPNEATLDLSIRSATHEGREVVLNHVKTIAEMQAASYGASAEFQHIRHGAVVVNDAALHDRLVDILTPRLGNDNVDPVGFKEMASEDFAFYGDHVPSFYGFLGIGDSKVNHNPGYAFNEKALVPGAAYWVAIAEGLLR